MVKLILVRHGYSLSNQDGTFTGQLDIGLTETGYRQAELVSDYLLKNYKVDAIYSSDLSRAVNTVKKVADTLNLSVIPVKELREIYGGKWEGVKFDSLKEEYGEFYERWTKDKGYVRCPDGECMDDVRIRALKAIEKICQENEGKTVLVATHGGVLRSLQCEFLNIPMSKFHEVQWIPNAGICIVEYENGKYTAKTMGFTKHLEGLDTNLPNI